MIGRLRGVLLEKHLTEIQLDVNGVIYELQVPMSTLYQLPDSGQSLELHTHLVIREDAHSLYGFATLAEKKLFRHLIKVSGVGPKLALTILSGMAADDFARTVTMNDIDALVRLPGVGKKTAERLIIEMRDKLEQWSSDITDSTTVSGKNQSQSFSQEAEAALVTLGYKPAEAGKIVAQILKTHNDIQDSEALIRLALKSMV